MAVSCQACPLRNRTLFTPMTPDEVAFMTGFKSHEVHVPSGETFIREGEESPVLFTVLSGMGTRFTLLEDGRLQVLNFVFPGDFIGLQAGVMGHMRHSARASTDMVLCAFPRARLWKMYQQNAERAFDLTWIAAVEEHFLGETIATLGQRDAAEKVAWALLRIWQRLVAIGAGDGTSVPLPFRQQDLADALGLSLVHTNKTLARLRAVGLATWVAGRLTVPDLRRLMDFARVDPDRIEKRPLM